MTILNWSFPRKDITRKAQSYQLALALRKEVAALEAAGCKVIQVRLAVYSLHFLFARVDCISMNKHWSHSNVAIAQSDFVSIIQR